jgi:hypothetical protein
VERPRVVVAHKKLPPPRCAAPKTRAVVRIAAEQHKTCEVGFLRRHCPYQVVEVAIRSPRPSGLSAQSPFVFKGTAAPWCEHAAPTELPRSPRRLLLTLLPSTPEEKTLLSIFSRIFLAWTGRSTRPRDDGMRTARRLGARAGSDAHRLDQLHLGRPRTARPGTRVLHHEPSALPPPASRTAPRSRPAFRATPARSGEDRRITGPPGRSGHRTKAAAGPPEGRPARSSISRAPRGSSGIPPASPSPPHRARNSARGTRRPRSPGLARGGRHHGH